MSSARKKYLRLFVLCVLFVGVIIAIGSCREIPPELPDDRDVLKVAGWPAPTVYDDDPLHPANRWYQRSFAPRDGLGRILALDGTKSPSRLENPGALDRAEIRSLLEALGAEPPEAGEGRVRCRRDLLAQAEYWGERDADLAALHRKTAETLAPAGKNP
ncbi:MAG: hypothetical protein VYB34_07730 [Planctomycetota bacterium]|nr:hypothetical protein [Planctomycetota bacterium]|tara:strand:+ start:278 stop:754 length:477 start_codon:yes stop_codon:yes gene_type:complete